MKKGRRGAICRACEERPAHKPRRLCYRCWREPGILDRFPPLARSVRGLGFGPGSGRLPAEPTQALPGSDEKIEVLAQRAARGEALFHPQDARHGQSDRPPLPILVMVEPEDETDDTLDDC